MSLIPAFDVGVWNAWIFIGLSFLTVIVPGDLINKEAGKKMNVSPPYSKTENVLALSTHAVIMPFTVVYSIFLPLKLGTVWFYVGLPVCFLALVMNLITSINIATTPLDEPVTKGIYRISRNPIYILWTILAIHWHRHSLRFLGFPAMRGGMDNPVAHCVTDRRTLLT